MQKKFAQFIRDIEDDARAIKLSKGPHTPVTLDTKKRNMTVREKSFGSPFFSPKTEAQKRGQAHEDQAINHIVLSVNEDDNDTVVERKSKNNLFFSHAEIKNSSGAVKEEKSGKKEGSEGKLARRATHDKNEEE